MDFQSTAASRRSATSESGGQVLDLIVRLYRMQFAEEALACVAAG
jgi:hypothetical protein